ncbi:hypothetical protein SAMN04488523_11382 [Sulfitobacter brevis]|uniref:Uncharacterized protein n=1 Tax=Sulfitobacter brevis TaxID=74348 RepID=A0A1I2EWI1_9RHOB|nr:hypothetical protein [Sulfitobacter brevis]SFE96808.1 hypothetical protein SAMN04488523_11382 [Sulfitobacter brevis]
MFKPFIAAGFVSIATLLPAFADVVSIEAVMVPQETIRMDFADGSKHFVLMVRIPVHPAGHSDNIRPPKPVYPAALV